MNRFIFDLQRFSSTVTIASGTSQNYDGVTYTANSDAVLNLDDEGKVSGITSGSVVAKLSDTDSSPQVTFDGSTAFDFSCSASDSALQVKASGTSISYTGGQVTYSADGFSGAGEVSVTGYMGNILPFDVVFDVPDSGIKFTFDSDNNTTTLNADEKVNATLTFPESVATLVESLKPLLTTLLGDDVSEDTANKLYAVMTKLVSSSTTAQIQGVHSWNQSDKKLTINKDSFLALNVLDYALSMTAEGGNVDGLSFFSQLTSDDPAIGARFTPSTDENAGLNFSLAKSGSKIYEGVLNVTAGAIDIDIVNVKASVEKDTAVTMTLQDGSLAEFKFDNAASVTYSADKSGLAYLTFGENDGKLLMTIYRDDKPVFNVGMEINGSLTLDTDNQTVGMTKDTTTIITIGDHTATINVTDDAGFKIGLSNDAITITPQEGDGSLNVSLAKGDETVFQNTVSVSNGSVIFNPATQEMTLTDGTTISFVINNNYTLTATASGDATSKLSLSTSGVTLTPSTDEDDGTLNLTLTGTSSGSLSANIKVLSGSFTLGESGALTVAKGTELQITFSDVYIINFKAIDDAGGTLSLGTDGITFAPGDGDGALELTVTRGVEKRTASLDVTGGSVTYKLDGSISLTEGTIVKNVFDDGNILTITANTTASGSIYFNPSGGLTIKPSTPDALTATLTTGELEVVRLTSIDGAITYSGGVITASAETTARIFYYFDWEADLYTTGGTASVQFTDDKTVYTANEGSTFVIKYSDGETIEIQNGSFSDIYETEEHEAMELVSEGSALRSNDTEFVTTLEKAGNYTLNGMDITTTKDLVQVTLSDYNTISFAADAGITYNGQEFSGDGIVSIINGNVAIGQIISNTIANTLISGSDGFDSISNSEANNVTITALGGNDTIINDHAYYPSINGGDGNDYIVVQRGDHSYIDGGAGKDTILGDASNDWAMGGYATINGGDGDDYIDTGSSDSSSIMGGAGDDIIITSGNDSTLNGGAGDDIISLHGASIDNNIIEYETGSGNDIIYGLNETGIISLTTGVEYSTAVSGDDVLLTVGENIITVAGMSEVNVVKYELEPLEITNTASNTLVTGTILNDSISNRGSKVTIDAQGGKDIVFNFGAETSINGGAGDDSIYNEGADDSTIEGDYGDDYLWNNSANVLINGSYGNDTLYNSGDNVTVKPGGGNDSITNDGGKNFVVEYTGGKDTIAGFNENSTLQIVGASYASLQSDNDLVLTVGDNMITLTDAASLDNVNIVSQKDLDTATALVTAVQYRTEAGYPVIAGMAFHPKEYHGDEPTNYAAKETLTIESDGLELSGVHYTPENSNDKWVIIIHGYGHNHKHMYPFAGFYLDNGYNVLMVDQRAAGDSEGDWLTMGTAESADIALWTQKIASLNSDAKITLFGVSMGAATAMLTAARSDITNVTSLVEDCGYTNVVELINLLNKSIPLNRSQSAIDLMPVVSERLTGYSLNDAAPINSLSAAKMPTLFITGTNDTVVPVSMLSALYDASGAEVKETFYVEGATHGVAGLYDTTGYSNTTFRFLAEANEEGWNTTNSEPDISLRGTKYNDTINNSDLGDNVTISTGEGNDTITSSGASVSIDAGTGENLVVFTDEADSNTVVLSGNTTVEGFKTGFGEGSDTVYIDGDPAGVEFKDGGLTFGNSTDSLALSGITTTSKVNIYHERRSVLNKGVFIAENDWYSVQSSDLSVGSGEEVYFVGTTSKSQVGVDFSGISSALNVTMDTAYEDSEDFVPGTTTWINSVYSLRGGAGNTTITGSKLSDTIIAGTGATTINAAGGDDVISLSSAAALVEYNSGDGDDTIKGFNANSTLSISGDAYSSKKSGNDLILTVGDDSITLQDAATLSNPDIIGTKASSVEEIVAQLPAASETYTVSASETKAEPISLKGGDLAVIEATSAKVSVSAGNDDTIVSEGENVTVNLKKNTNTKIYATGGKMTVQGYDPSKGAGFGTTYDDIFDAISNNNIYFNKGRLTIGSALVVDGDGKNNLVNFYDANGDLQKVAHTPQDGSLNLSSETADLIATATENSTLTGGKGSDSIFAYAGSFVDAGAGNNYIQIDTEERGANDDGITVALTSGKNTIANFSAGFNDTNDRLFVGVRDTIDFKFDGTQLKFYNNDELRGVISDIADSGSSVNFLVADAKSVMKMVAIQTGEAVTVEDEIADYYRGEKSGVNFGNYEGNLYVNLGSQEQSIGTGEVLFDGINQITIGSGQNTLIGSSHSETLTSNADGTTEFIFSKGNGKDLIRSFNFEDDKISVGNETITAVNINSSGGVRMEISGDGSVTLEDAQGKNFKINNFVAQVDTNVIYDGEANYFVATQANAAISVSADAGDAEIWLDGSHGKTFVGDIRTIDASNATGKTSLAGNDLDNVIYGGSYSNALWGGNGGDDLLIGGAGKNAFFYTNGNGDDTIAGAQADDVVFLSEVSLEQLASTSVENNVATINFKDGGKLTINDASNCNFVMTQGDQSQLYKVSGNQFIAG